MSQPSHARHERRSYPRLPMRFDIEGAPAECADAVTVRMKGSNLSVGGLFCTSPAGWPPMSRLDVRLHLPGEAGPIVAEAIVVRCRERSDAAEEERFEMALLFAGFEPGDRDRLEARLTDAGE